MCINTKLKSQPTSSPYSVYLPEPQAENINIAVGSITQQKAKEVAVTRVSSNKAMPRGGMPLKRCSRKDENRRVLLGVSVYRECVLEYKDSH